MKSLPTFYSGKIAMKIAAKNAKEREEKAYTLVFWCLGALVAKFSSSPGEGVTACRRYIFIEPDEVKKLNLLLTVLQMGPQHGGMEYSGLSRFCFPFLSYYFAALRG